MSARSINPNFRVFSFFAVVINLSRNYLSRLIFLCLSLSLTLFPLTARCDVLVFAASSMTEGLNKIVAEYSKETGETVRVSYGASSSLARQLTHGAPADIYISANQTWMAYANKHQVLNTKTISPWLGNKLVLISAGTESKTVDLSLKSIKNALQGTRLAMADPSHVPAGIYAKQALEKLHLWKGLSGELAFSNNVRGALSLVQRKEALLGIVYYSDALHAKGIKIAQPFLEKDHDPIIYTKALTKMAKPAAATFFDYLSSPYANRLFTEMGFRFITPSDKGTGLCC